MDRASRAATRSNPASRVYAALFTVKFTLKLGGRLDFKVNKLECLYVSDPATTPMSE